MEFQRTFLSSPDHFELEAHRKRRPAFNLIKRLLKRSDLDEVINACDAGREGELIFHYLAEASGQQETHPPPLAAKHDCR